jgi:hypothetical protein
VLVGVLLVPAVVVPLWVPLYDRDDPTFAGFPFFYWFQFALILGAVVLTVSAYLVARGADRGDRVAHGLPPEPPGDNGPDEPGTDRKAGGVR